MDSLQPKTKDQIASALLTLSLVVFLSSILIAGSIYVSGKMLGDKFKELPGANAEKIAQIDTIKSDTGTTTVVAKTDTSLPNIGGALTVKKDLKPTSTSPDIKDLPFLGNKDAKVTVVEFSDYECPFCHKFYAETITKLQKEYVETGKVKFIYKDFPLYSIHKKSIPAATAARCAGAQNKYYEMHNALFDNFDTWPKSASLKDAFMAIGKNIGLNSSSFEVCLTNDSMKAEIEKQYTEGYYLGIRGTPTTFINGKMLADQNGDSLGSLDYATLKGLIDKALKE